MMQVNTERESLALDLERMARELDRLRVRHDGELHGRPAADVDDIFADTYALAHRLAPELVPATPTWQSPATVDKDARNLARRIADLPMPPPRRPRLRIVRGGKTG